MELRTDAKLWEVQWSELSIVRPIGKGEQCCFGMHAQAPAHLLNAMTATAQCLPNPTLQALSALSIWPNGTKRSLPAKC